MKRLILLPLLLLLIFTAHSYAASETPIVPITPGDGATGDGVTGDETLCRGPVREAVKAVASRLAAREWFHRQPVRRILRAAAGVGRVACRRRR